jgi:hypothetical protein
LCAGEAAVGVGAPRREAGLRGDGSGGGLRRRDIFFDFFSIFFRFFSIFFDPPFVVVVVVGVGGLPAALIAEEG